MRSALLLIGLLLVAAGVMSWLGFGPVVINREGQARIALMMGDPRWVMTEPGLHLVPPFVNVETFDSRWQHLSSEPKEIPTLDQERVVLDHYVIWRIEDPLKFRRSFPTGMQEAEKQIDQQVRGKVREVIGQHTLTQVLKDDRVAIMKEITEKSAPPVERLGVKIADVRISRTELPRGTEANVFARMRAERDRLARKYRAQGEGEARRIHAEADRNATVLVAEAKRDAEIERGRGDAEAARIYAEAYGQDPDFYAFVRNLEAYRKTIGKGTTVVLPPDSGFFRLLGTGGAPPPPGKP